VPARIPVHEFQPNRSQQRNRRSNAGLQVRLDKFVFSYQQFALYRRYMQWRHPGSSMDDDNAEHYQACFASRWCETLTLTVHAGRRLVAVAITDRLEDGLSAVYTYFEPELAVCGLGTFAVLEQIEAARAAGLAHLYLGYWIEASPKMRYKTHYHPLELFRGGHWQPYTRRDAP
jgi:arginine-tRNA-protein transferase